jgi:cell wall-associated NlpC family hydrolase
MVTGVLVAAGSALPDSRIREKQAEARRILAQVESLGHSLDRATEAYNGATYRLGQTRASLRENRIELRVARHNYDVAERVLAMRVRRLYVTSTGDSTLEVILGARSFDEIVSLLDAKSRISHEDVYLAAEVRRFRAAVTRRHRLLEHARRIEEQIVAERVAARARIVHGLADQRRLLASIHGEITRLRAEEAAQQALLAAQARARLIQQRLTEQQALRSAVVGATVESPGATGNPSAVVLPPSAVGARVVQIAVQYLGRPYVWGAAGPDAFDCSGLVTYVFAQIGISLPHFAAAQWNYGVYVPMDQLEPGDLVFFESLGHVGIYVGNGSYIQAPQPGDVVKITPLSDPWSAANYYGARRILS